MNIVPEYDDAEEFVADVERVTKGLVHQYAPTQIVLIKINNWFGSNWLGFSGKVLGAVGYWKATLTVPPFVPNRVVWQKRFAAPTYDETVAGKPVHVRKPSELAMARKMSEVAPGAAVVWYSGNSQKTGRGCVLVYVPTGESYWSWYASWANEQSWRIVETQRINREDLSKLMKQDSTRAPVPE